MIFLRYESFQQYIRFYPVTSLLLLANVIMFLVVTFSPDEDALIQLLAIHNVFGSPDIHMFVTSMFLHGSFGHLLFNGFALFVFAPPLERLLGIFKYALLYFVSGIMGNVATDLFYQTTYISIGASGAVFGLFGAYLFLVLFRKGSMDPQSAKTIQVILVIGIVYSLVMANIGDVNLFAHLGGLFAGFGLFALMIRFGYNK